MRFIRQTDGQIRALETFTLYDGRTIAAGTLGGIIASARNLAQSGACWVFPGASIEGNAYVSGNAVVQNDIHGRQGRVLDDARVYGNALINGGIVSGRARVLGDATVESDSLVTDEAHVSGSAKILRNFPLERRGEILGKARVQGEAIIIGGRVRDEAKVIA